MRSADETSQATGNRSGASSSGCGTVPSCNAPLADPSRRAEQSAAWLHRWPRSNCLKMLEFCGHVQGLHWFVVHRNSSVTVHSCQCPCSGMLEEVIVNYPCCKILGHDHSTYVKDSSCHGMCWASPREEIVQVFAHIMSRQPQQSGEGREGLDCIFERQFKSGQTTVVMHSVPFIFLIIHECTWTSHSDLVRKERKIMFILHVCLVIQIVFIRFVFSYLRGQLDCINSLASLVVSDPLAVARCLDQRCD